MFGAAAAWAKGRRLALVVLILPSLLALTATDSQTSLLPNRIVYPTIGTALALCWAWPDRTIAAVLLGGAAGIGVMLVVSLPLPGIGFRDVRLPALLSLLSGLGILVLASMIAAPTAGAASVLLFVTRRIGLNGAIAYGAHLA